MVNYYFTDNYSHVGQALVLVFSTYPFERPIRPHKWHVYDYVLTAGQPGRKD